MAPDTEVGFSAELKAMRRHAREVFRAGLAAVDPCAAVLRHVILDENVLHIGEHRFELQDIQRILVVGAGKAGAPMALALERLLGDRIGDGVIVVKEGHALSLERIRTHEAGHPVPDQRGVAGAEAMISLVSGCGARDLVLCLISGGGSALLVSPVQGVTLADKQAVTRLLLASGANIHETNTVRKHLSRVKGGGLARLAHPATVVSLILSDVVGDDLNVIASGPAVPDTSTFRDALSILERYGLWEQVPPSVKNRIRAGLNGEVGDTPKAGDAVFDRCHYQLIGTNLQVLEAAARQARQLGYRCLILSSSIEGEAREAAKVLAAVAREIRRSGNPLAPPACVLCGGETTVSIRGDGKGGRNQEFALAAVSLLEGCGGVVILASGTDGTDGPTDAAGAIADSMSMVRARAAGMDPLDYLDRNDAYHFFQKLDDLVITGPTRTNVMDVYLALIA